MLGVSDVGEAVKYIPIMNKIAVIGLGYVGLPLARLFATKHHVIGFDIHQKRVDEINSGKDSTNELTAKVLSAVIQKTNQNLYVFHLR